MSAERCQAGDAPSAPAHGPWGPLAGLNPVQEYGVLARELQACFPDATPQRLDGMIAYEMALYGGHSPAVIVQAMLEASLYLATGDVSEARTYVERTVNAAMLRVARAQTALGWGA